jgi:hypothetical protein
MEASGDRVVFVGDGVTHVLRHRPDASDVILEAVKPELDARGS